MNVLIMNCSPVRNGATAEIVKIVASELEIQHKIKTVCIDDYNILLCKGCRTCHNTAEPHATISSGKKGYTIALRTGPSMPECERIIGSIEHFYGHMEIECCGHLGLCSIEYKEDVAGQKDKIVKFCKGISI